MPNQSTGEDRAVAELREGAAKARQRVTSDAETGRKTPSWIRALAATRA
jgi:hypothetical protein